MNIVSGLHSTLISVPKLADAGYTTVFSKARPAIYDDYTTTISASNPPVLDADRCDRTGLWKLLLDNKIKVTNMNSPTTKAINAIFDLPSTRQTFLWYHAAAGFPVKESFIKAVRNGNYATWPKLTITLINKYMPDSDETAKGHLKGQCQGIRSTKHNASREKAHLSSRSHPPNSTTYLFAWWASLMKSTPPKRALSPTHPKEATTTLWWPSTSMQTTSLRNL